MALWEGASDSTFPKDVSQTSQKRTKNKYRRRRGKQEVMSFLGDQGIYRKSYIKPPL